MQLLQVKSTKLQELRDQGNIRYSKVGSRNLLFDRQSILKYIEDHTKETF